MPVFEQSILRADSEGSKHTDHMTFGVSSELCSTVGMTCTCIGHSGAIDCDQLLSTNHTCALGRTKDLRLHALHSAKIRRHRQLELTRTHAVAARREESHGGRVSYGHAKSILPSDQLNLAGAVINSMHQRSTTVPLVLRTVEGAALSGGTTTSSESSSLMRCPPQGGAALSTCRKKHINKISAIASYHSHYDQ